MKNIAKLFIFALALIFVAASCEKEGVYNPKQKISKIYRSSSYTSESGDSSTAKYLQEVWNWDADLLTSITLYDNTGEKWKTENFTYDGKRLTQITTNNDEKYEFIYDGKYLSHMNEYTDGKLQTKYEFIHNGNKITQINVSYVSELKSSFAMAPSFFRFFLPNMNEQVANQLADIEKLINTKGENGFSINFEWKKNNIVKATTKGIGNDIINEYTYDNKVNPYYGLFAYEHIGFSILCSANNVITNANQSTGKTIAYSYTYDGKYPIEKNTTTNIGNDESHTLTVINYYEYK